MSEEKKHKIIQIILSLFLLIVVIIINKIFSFDIVIKTIMFVIPYLVLSYDIYIEAFENIKEGEVFDECFLMCLATIGAFCIGFFPQCDPQVLEANFVMLFFQIGELFEIIAEDEGERSINSLLSIRPDYANLELDDGKTKKVDPNTIKLLDIICVYPGEKVPVDGMVIEGNSNINTVALTGESLPRSIHEGDYVMSGCINLNSVIRLKVVKTFNESTASKIIEMVTESNENKANTDKFITKFSKVYTPAVILFALFLAFIPPLFTQEYAKWLVRSLTFLVVSCPCALVISVPLTYFGGVCSASKKGILIKGAKYLEDISKISIMAFDKTGTLTHGSFDVVAIHPEEYNEKELLHLAAHVETFCSHPIANSLKKAYDKYDKLDDTCVIKDIKELPGQGIKATVNNDLIYVGNKKLMDSIKVKIKDCHFDKTGTIIHVAKEDSYLGHIVISDRIRDESKNTIDYLKNNNIDIVMLTGDTRNVSECISSELGINECYYELMPKDKVKIINKLKKRINSNNRVAFVGDGINDAPVLSRSDLGIAMGGIGSDAAIEAANVVLMNDNINNIVEVVNISKKTQSIVIENIIFIILIKFLVLFLTSIGVTSMILAVFADVGVTLIAIVNSLRMLKYK